MMGEKTHPLTYLRFVPTAILSPKLKDWFALGMAYKDEGGWADTAVVASDEGAIGTVAEDVAVGGVAGSTGVGIHGTGTDEDVARHGVDSDGDG